MLRRGEVGLAGPEADDVLAGRLQGLGLGVDGERRRLGDGGEAGWRLDSRLPCFHSESPRPHCVGRSPESAARRRPIRLRAVEGTPEQIDAVLAARRRSSARRTVRRRSRASSARSAAASPSCSACRTGGRSSSATAARRCSGTSPRSGSSSAAASTSCSASSPASSPTPAPPHHTSPIPSVITAQPGDHPDPVADADVDVYALTHNETSTGVAMELRRPDGGRRHRSSSSTPRRRPAAAVGPGRGRRLLLRPAEVLRRRRRPVDRRLLARRDRADRAHRRLRRWRPASLDLAIARDNSRLDQTYNTPAVTTLVLFASQLEWMLELGGLAACAKRSQASAEHLYGWAEATAVDDAVRRRPGEASNVVGTIDLDGRIDVGKLNAAARQRDRRHRRLPQARPQPDPHRHVPGDRDVRHRRPDGLHRPPRRAPRRRPEIRDGKRWPLRDDEIVVARPIRCCSSPSADGSTPPGGDVGAASRSPTGRTASSSARSIRIRSTTSPSPDRRSRTSTASGTSSGRPTSSVPSARRRRVVTSSSSTGSSRTSPGRPTSAASSRRSTGSASASSSRSAPSPTRRRTPGRPPVVGSTPIALAATFGLAGPTYQGPTGVIGVLHGALEAQGVPRSRSRRRARLPPRGRAPTLGRRPRRPHRRTCSASPCPSTSASRSACGTMPTTPGSPATSAARLRRVARAALRLTHQTGHRDTDLAAHFEDLLRVARPRCNGRRRRRTPHP